MAINTVRRRFSMLNFSSIDDVLPVSTGSFDQGDRQTLLVLYSGILTGEPVAVVPRKDGGGHGSVLVPPRRYDELALEDESEAIAAIMIAIAVYLNE